MSAITIIPELEGVENVQVLDETPLVCTDEGPPSFCSRTPYRTADGYNQLSLVHPVEFLLTTGCGAVSANLHSYFGENNRLIPSRAHTESTMWERPSARMRPRLSLQYFDYEYEAEVEDGDCEPGDIRCIFVINLRCDGEPVLGVYNDQLDLDWGPAFDHPFFPGVLETMRILGDAPDARRKAFEDELFQVFVWTLPRAVKAVQDGGPIPGLSETGYRRVDELAREYHFDSRNRLTWNPTRASTVTARAPTRSAMPAATEVATAVLDLNPAERSFL